MKRLACLPLIFFALNVFAQPNQIDIIGIVPGVSDKAAIDSLSIDNEGSFFEIGGFRIPCNANFDNSNKLEDFTCFTGTASGIPLTELSNTAIHSELVRGFTKKFGNPTSIIEVPVRTSNGATYKNQIVTWKDKKNNELVLSRMLDTIDSGVFELKSNSLLKKEKEESKARKSREKF